MLATTAFAARRTGLESGLSLPPRHNPLGCLTSSLYTFSRGLFILESFARDYPASGFPEFLRRSHVGFPACSPLGKQLPSAPITGGSGSSLSLLNMDGRTVTAEADEYLA